MRRGQTQQLLGRGSDDHGHAKLARRIHGEPEGTAPEVERALNYYAADSRPLIAAAVQRCFDDGTPWEQALSEVMELQAQQEGGEP